MVWRARKVRDVAAAGVKMMFSFQKLGRRSRRRTTAAAFFLINTAGKHLVPRRAAEAAVLKRKGLFVSASIEHMDAENSILCLICASFWEFSCYLSPAIFCDALTSGITLLSYGRACNH